MPRRVLFLCTGNCVRSQMAEALLRYRGGARFDAVSAGSRPAGFVHPLAIYVLEELGAPVAHLRSKPWTEFENAPLDAVITLCGSAQKEVCAAWPAPPAGRLPVRAHWGFNDPSAFLLFSEEEQLAAFRRVRDEIRRCIERLALAPEAILRDDAAFANLIRRIAEEDAPNPE